MFDYVYKESLRRAKHKVWVLSDLQQRDPDKARECLDVCMADFHEMGCPADMIWYLGDGVEGADYAHLMQMCRMQEEAFASTGLPLCYALGNHDLEYALSEAQQGRVPVIPFWETVKHHEGWHTLAHYTDRYFRVMLGDWAVYFFSDHIAEDKSWIYIHGDIWGNKDAYPYYDDAERIRQQMEREEHPIITASHYSFAGGNRASGMQSRLQPLPPQVKLHLYGHAHIGDYDWAGQHAWRRISWVDWQDIPQINVSSFEHIRGKTCRSVLLHIYEDGSFGVFFRDHDHRRFSEVYLPSPDQGPSGFKR